MEKKRLASLQELELSSYSTKSKEQSQKKQDLTSEDSVKRSSEHKLSYAEQRERDKAMRRAAKKVEEAEIAVASMEEKLAQVEAKISAGDVSPQVFNDHAEITKGLENAMSMWELAQMDFDELKEKYNL